MEEECSNQIRCTIQTFDKLGFRPGASEYET